MGSYTQRKRFEYVELARRTADAFHERDFKVPLVHVTTRIAEELDGIWLYITQEGPHISEQTPSDPGAILPDYELVE